MPRPNAARRQTAARPPLALRTCVRCRQATFDPHQRDVSDWPIIDDLDASDHCRACWMDMAKTQGRPLGQPRPG